MSCEVDAVAVARLEAYFAQIGGQLARRRFDLA
jgi:hypothetical protein